MDEPVVYVRDGAMQLTLPLGEVLYMLAQARELAAAAQKHVAGARETVEAVLRSSQVPGPHRARAQLSAYLLNAEMHAVDAERQRNVIVAEATVVGAAPAPPPAPAAAPATPACNHPSDTACPACAHTYMDRRNAQKREQREARGLK